MYSDDGVLNVGISKVDKEHEAIGLLCKEISKAIRYEKTSEKVKSSMLDLAVMIEQHFRNEEHLFEPLKLALEKKHKEEHKALVGKLATIIENIDKGNSVLQQNFDNFNDSLQRHISYDFEMKHSNGISE